MNIYYSWIYEINSWIYLLFNNNISIPFVIVSLIGIWHLTEYVHVIDQAKNGRHCKSNVDKIIANTE